MKKLPSKYYSGFTFIELLVYIAIVTVVLASLVKFAWTVIGSSTKSGVEQEVYANARYVSERIKYEIRNANSITSVTSNSISYVDSSAIASTISLSSGKIRINKGSAVDLNSTDTTVSSLTFTNYTSSDNKTKNIQFNFTIQSNYSSVRQEYQESVTIQSSAEVRSN